VELEIDHSLPVVAVEVAIKHMYGFDFPHNSDLTPTIFEDFVAICAVAEQYQIDDLLGQALRAANRALTDCLTDECDDEDALHDFLSCGRSWMFTDERYLEFAVAVLGRNVTKLHTKKVFLDLLKTSPELTRHLFDDMVEDKVNREALGTTN
jgi:hypothetical protein